MILFPNNILKYGHVCRYQAPSFKISEPPRREQLAMELAEKAGEKNRSQKKKNLDAQRRQLTS